jgi:hypothetical protein
MPFSAVLAPDGFFWAQQWNDEMLNHEFQRFLRAKKTRGNFDRKPGQGVHGFLISLRLNPVPRPGGLGSSGEKLNAEGIV